MEVVLASTALDLGGERLVVGVGWVLLFWVCEYSCVMCVWIAVGRVLGGVV